MYLPILSTYSLIADETIEERKVKIRAKLTHYTKRAEELKCMLTIDPANREKDQCSCLNMNTSSPSVHSRTNCDTDKTKLPRTAENKHTALKQLRN